jgi:hypothetical protein
VSADLRDAAARQSPRSATRPKGARQPASQPGGANLNRDENAAKVTRTQWSRPRPRESARDVREVVREHLRAPEQGAPRANAHRAAQRAPNRAKGPEAALRAAILALIGTIGRVVPDRDGWMLDAAAAAAESGNLLLALRMVLIISE